MKKLTLDLDSLAITSFCVQERCTAEAGGTVQARAYSYNTDCQRSRDNMCDPQPLTTPVC
jgi:hypothetical protein